LYKQKIITMKKFIKEIERENKEWNESVFIQFRTNRDDVGHIAKQFPCWNNQGEWVIEFNCRCVHISKTLDSAVRKLEQLGVTQQNLFF
jgi:hypothetical protein